MSRFWSVLLVFCTVCGIASADQIRLVTLEGGQNSRIRALVMEEAYSRAEIDVSFEIVPARRAAVMVETGQVDGETSRVFAYGNSRDYLIRLSTPIGHLHTTAFTRVDSPLAIDSLTAMEGLTVGVVRGIRHAERAAANASQVVFAKSIAELMKLVDHGRVDVAIHSRWAGELTIASLGLETVIAQNENLGSQSVHHFLRQEFAHEAARIDAVLQIMDQSGEILSIVERERAKVAEQLKAGTNG